MRDANDLLNAFKKAAMDALKASHPTDYCFGKVISSSPLKISIEQKMTLGAAQLVLSRNVTDYAVNMSIDYQTASALSSHNHKLQGDTESYNSHSHSLSGDTTDVDLTHTHSVSGTTQITIHNALQIGDEVILLKQNGGQKYLVLDRLVKI